MPSPHLPHDLSRSPSPLEASEAREQPSVSLASPTPPLSKAAVRKAILAQRAALSPAEAARLSAVIEQRVLAEPHWQEAAIVALYVAVRNEVSTETLLQAAWAAGKQVLLPRCLPPKEGAGRMEFALCRGHGELVPGAYGLSEPGPQCPVWTCATGNVTPSSLFLLVPAVGISPCGARIGYGKGYYDRFLTQPGWKNVPRVALIYRFQLVPFPSDALDVSMHGAITEKEVQWF